jgi:hypothetical protein
MTIRGLIALAALGLLAGCAPTYLPVDAAGRTTAAPPAAAAEVASPPDACGASRLQYLIGKPKSQIPVPADLSKRRVACTTCVSSEITDPTRVTILFDQSTGLVTKAICQ